MKNDISTLLQLEQNCRSCESSTELNYLIVNETRKIVDYEQAVLLAADISGKLKTEAISDLALIDKTAPFTQWVESISEDIHKLDKSKTVYEVNISADLNNLQKEEMKDYSPSNILWVPLTMTRENIKVEYSRVLRKKKILQNDIFLNKTNLKCYGN